jgi:hypothetical protein
MDTTLVVGELPLEGQCLGEEIVPGDQGGAISCIRH